ncbi:complement C1q tumor necrosis factor-related protein 3-like [Oreochromis niloticus]|uniref:Cerebellin 10 n=1 Tax=Oreochromis niloticus TaxID=8128 RepID=A0A669CSE9_ORENI|nr:complement C1q tumor necrosis factor-related protein 3-like [Oreochromis niloticus]
MEIIMYFSLLLLLCSVSTGQPEADEKSLAQQIELQQPCPKDIHAVLREITASLTEQKAKIAFLEKENQVKKVAFSASLLYPSPAETGPFNTDITLIFTRVVTNIGNAYNPSTGIFTAPVRGAYHFDWSVYGYGNIAAGGVLFRNGEHIFIAYEHPTSGTSASASNGASLLLEVGNQVSVRLLGGTRIQDSQNYHNTFSGHLIFTM